MTRRAKLLEITATTLFVGWYVFVSQALYRPDREVIRTTADFFAHVLLILTRLPRNIDSLLLTLSFVIASITPGYAFTYLCRVHWRSSSERLLFSCVCGLALVTFGILILGSERLLRPEPLFLACFIFLVFAIWIIVRERDERYDALLREPPSVRVKPTTTIIVLSAILAILLLIVILPGALEFELSYDGMHYHLAEGKRFAMYGGFYNLVTAERAYESALPHYQEDLFAGLITMFGLVSAKLLCWFDAVFAVLATCLLSYELLGTLTLGLLASIVFVCTPVVMFSANVAGNDIPLAPLATLALYASMRWKLDQSQIGFIFIAGALAGYGIGVKPFGLLTVAACGAVIIPTCVKSVWQARDAKSRAIRQSARSICLFGIAVLAFSLPTMICSWQSIGNPFFPIFGPRVDNGNIGGNYRSNIIENLFVLPFRMTIDPSFRSIIGPMFVVMIPIAVLAAWKLNERFRPLRSVWMFVAAWLLCYYLVGGFEPRYAEAVFPAVSILLCVPLFLWSSHVLLRSAVGSVIALIVSLNLPFLLPLQRPYGLPGTNGGVRYNWGYLYEHLAYNGEPPQNLPMIPFINAHLSSSDKVYDDADLFGANLYSNVELYFPGAIWANDWSLVSKDAPDQFAHHHITYLVTFARRIPMLEKTYLWRHLTAVKHFPATQQYAADQDFAETLFRFR